MDSLTGGPGCVGPRQPGPFSLVGLSFSVSYPLYKSNEMQRKPGATERLWQGRGDGLENLVLRTPRGALRFVPEASPPSTNLRLQACLPSGQCGDA